mgnify:CR=1 FL=1
MAGATGSTTYSPEAYRIYAIPADAQPTGQPAPNRLDWPSALPALASLPTISVPPGARCVVAEAASSFGWERVAGQGALLIGIERFGASAPDKVLAEQFGFTAPRLAETITRHFGKS